MNRRQIAANYGVIRRMRVKMIDLKKEIEELKKGPIESYQA